MLTEIADGVFVRQSAFCQSNAIVVRGADGLLVVDPGVDGGDLDELVDDVSRLGRPVVAGFATHPHWDHLLWHRALGDVPRYGTRRCVAASDAWVDDAREKAARLAPGAPLDLLGGVTPVPGAAIPWDGPVVRIAEHQAHAPGHAALLVEHAQVLLVGDMLSDVEMPLLDLEADDPLGDYAAAMNLLETTAAAILTLVPGHGGVADRPEIARRVDADRHYVTALQRGVVPDDARVGPDATYGRDWLPQTHARQLQLVGL